MSHVRVERLTRRFGERLALSEVSFEAPAGRLTAVLGPSGGGKSTLLRLIAGLETPDAGEVFIGDRRVSSAGDVAAPPQNRGIGMVFQSYALWPHLSAFENVAFPLRVRGAAEDEIRSRVAAAAALTRLPGGLERRPHEFSGGEQQRVALARAIVYEPQVLLLDEPLANLDARVREDVRAEIAGLQRRLGVTAVYVTHDQSEAFSLADRVVLVDSGRLVDEGTPEGLYRRPRSAAAARFLGATNRLPATVRRAGLAVSAEAFGLLTKVEGLEGLSEGAPVELLFRPDDLILARDGAGWPVTTVGRSFLGEHVVVEAQGDGFRLTARLAADEAPGIGASLRLALKPGRGLAY